MIKVTLSQLTCLYQLALVMGSSVMCGFFGSYFLFLFGSEVFAMLGDTCVEAIVNVKEEERGNLVRTKPKEC